MCTCLTTRRNYDILLTQVKHGDFVFYGLAGVTQGAMVAALAAFSFAEILWNPLRVVLTVVLPVAVRIP